MADAQSIAMNLASASVGGGATAWVASVLLKNMLNRFNEMTKAVAAVEKAISAMVVEIKNFAVGIARIEANLKEVQEICADLTERIAYLEARAEIEKDHITKRQ